MPSLINERIRDREESMRAFDAARPGGSRFSRMMSGGDSLKRDRFERDTAFKAAELQRKTEADLRRAEHQERQTAIQYEISEFNRLLAETKLEDTRKSVRDATGFLKKTAGIREDDPFFDDVIASAVEEFPDSINQQVIKDRLQWLLGRRATSLDAKRERAKLAEAERMATGKGLVAEKVVAEGVTYGKPEEPKVTTVTETLSPDEMTRTQKTVTGTPSQLKTAIPAAAPIAPSELFEELGVKKRPPAAPLGAIEG